MECTRYSVAVPNKFSFHISEYDNLVTIEPEEKRGSIIITRWCGRYFPRLFNNSFGFFEEKDKIKKYLQDNVRQIFSGQDSNVRIVQIIISSYRYGSLPNYTESSSFAVIICMDFSGGIFSSSCLNRVYSSPLTVDDRIDFGFYICDDPQPVAMCCEAKTIHPDTYYKIRSSIDRIGVSQFARRITTDEKEYWAMCNNYTFDTRHSSEYLVERYTGLSSPAPHITSCRLETLERVEDRSGDYIPIEELDLSKVTYRALQSNGFITIYDILHYYETGYSYMVHNTYHHPFERLQGFGSACAKDLEKKMRAYGYAEFSLTSPPKRFSKE